MANMIEEKIVSSMDKNNQAKRLVFDDYWLNCQLFIRQTMESISTMESIFLIF